VSDVFLSYASADRPRVAPLVEALRERGWSVWWDRTIPPGKTWDQVIESALADARCVVVLWSRRSIESHWVLTEAEEARNRRILVPALLEDVTIPLAFRRFQAANLVNWSGGMPSAGFDALAGAVAEVLSSNAPAPVPKDPTAPDLERRSPRASAARLLHAGFLNTPAKRLIILGSTAVALIGIAMYVRALAQQSAKTPPSAQHAGAAADGPQTSSRVRENAKDGLTYAWIPPGRFTMGCSPGDGQCGPDEKPPHAVNISKGFWMGKTEVTEDAYQRVMGQNPSRIKGAQRPVENVTWKDASEYCGKVTLRLPTEAEWEYAAGAGTAGPRYGELDKIAWYFGNSGRETKPAGALQPNSFGLYDMLGNVWEWTADRYGGYTAGEATDPPGPPDGKYRVVRGGSWFNDPQLVRVSVRGRGLPTDRGNDVGFRCAGELR
jgi:formylglycine-generating enzyme required for sulfatase activity